MVSKQLRAVVFTVSPVEGLIVLLDALRHRGYSVPLVVTALGPNAYLTQEHYDESSARVSSYYSRLTVNNSTLENPPAIMFVHKAGQVELPFFGLDPDLAISFGFPYPLTRRLLTHRAKFVNLHTAPLPSLAGPNPHVWSILRPDLLDMDSFCVTWHYMSPDVDKGPIIKEEKVDFGGAVAAQTLTAKKVQQMTASVILSGMEEVLHLVEQGYEGVQQNAVTSQADSTHSRARMLSDNERLITADRTAEEILRLQRAIGGTEWPPLLQFSGDLYKVTSVVKAIEKDRLVKIEAPGTARREGLNITYACIGGPVIFSVRKI